MTVNDPTGPAIGDSEEHQPGVARKNRGVRFSDSEWDEVRQAAQVLGITPAEFVRERILALVRRPPDADSAAIPANLVPLIERTFRYTYMLATKMRDRSGPRRPAPATLKLSSRKHANCRMNSGPAERIDHADPVGTGSTTHVSTQQIPEGNEPMPLVVDRARLPEDWPTNRGSPAFWEELGRTVAALTHLEDMLARAHFGLTGSRAFANMDEARAAFPDWEKALRASLTDSLGPLTKKLGKAFRNDDRVANDRRSQCPHTPQRPPGLAQCPVPREHGRASRRTGRPRFVTSGTAPTGLSSWKTA